MNERRGWPIRALLSRPHAHPRKNLWLDSDEDMWRCDFRKCAWSRPAEPWEICAWFGGSDLGGHVVVGSIVTAIAPEVCSRCGAPLCLLRPRLAS